jgi:hypothetical protein
MRPDSKFLRQRITQQQQQQQASVTKVSIGYGDKGATTLSIEHNDSQHKLYKIVLCYAECRGIAGSAGCRGGLGTHVVLIKLKFVS